MLTTPVVRLSLWAAMAAVAGCVGAGSASPAAQAETVAAAPLTTDAGGGVRQYGTFFYVPALRSPAWISGEDTPVVLLKPPV